ncbi:helix-turn-helix domain-containing protein [Shimazuella sp. AN120528]|uniref:helix-turn-helix domain-containing protein n=1 Tax=Shimazuella soli TaxID=1892854 RepID=UPI001F0EEDE1|nr:helix-turn-helix domain-containing protein [Shimazuella soli]MCH5586429.1 helix-turn-helix domain-containing protein [Shimazuella soli]
MSQLKEVRETSFLDLEEISDHLSIPKLYLQAIEEGDFSHLPQKRQLAERYITTYADFLEVDVDPIIDSYRHFRRPEQTFTPRRRGSRSARSKEKPVWYTYRYYLLICGACLSSALVAWLFIPSEKSGSTNSMKQPLQNQTTPVSFNKERPIFTLQKASSDSSIEQTWFISQADYIHVQIQSLEDVNFRIREDNIKGKIIADKELSKSESFDLNGKKWVFIHIDDPSKVIMRVNDVVIDTVSQKTGTTYEFKIVSN